MVEETLMLTDVQRIMGFKITLKATHTNSLVPISYSLISNNHVAKPRALTQRSQSITVPTFYSHIESHARRVFGPNLLQSHCKPRSQNLSSKLLIVTLQSHAYRLFNTVADPTGRSH